jgi:uncharacterized membrane protein
MPGSEHPRRRRGVERSVDRLINFSDAVVAVAVTLMVLPLIDIEGPAEGQTILTTLADHALPITTFLFTFYVVCILWLAHNRILNVIADYDPPLFWLNVTWLAAIVLLPWVSSMSGDASNTAGGAALLYWVMLALIAGLGSLMGRHIRRHPEIQYGSLGDDGGNDRRSELRGPVFAGYFLFIGLVSLVSPDMSRWLPMGIIPLSIWLRPAREDQSSPGEPRTESTEEHA